jgi:class 3 adenylate cyclase/tetratricopeptide (TPR) repeat protein
LITCSNCGHDNSEDAKFCQKCGRSLFKICDNCNVDNASDARFCKNCGQQLISVTPPQSTERKSKTAPAKEGGGERRIVTVLFCDVVGSTSLAEQLDPETWTELMNGLFAQLIPAITRYDGTVSRLMGDAILAFFGAPVAHEDDPYRAVRAALDMRRDFGPYQEKIKNKLERVGVPITPTDFEVRIGINTGLAVVGDIGSGQKQEYTAMGDAVNLAARMEQTALPGTIQISHDTYKLVASLVEVESLDPIKVKGKRDPVLTYQVLGLKARPDQTRNFEGMESPLIGREQEMSLLGNALDRLLEGYGQIVCLIGEAGLGKSRLVQELIHQSHQPQNAVSWFEVESLSFEYSRPYGLLQRMLRQMGSISKDDPQEVISKKITSLLEYLAPDKRLEFKRALEALFGLENKDGQPLQQGEELKQELFTGMLTLTQAWTSAGPTVFVLEDLHWADSASVELIRHLLPVADTASLLYLFVFRPFRHSPAWTIKQTAEIESPHCYLEIVLRPLSAQESSNLVGNLLNISSLPGKLKSSILDKAAGVPFFVEEIVRDLIESGAVIPSDDGYAWQLSTEAEDLRIPENLETVLVARIDRLKEESRLILQLAAVIGRSFTYWILEMIAGDIGQLDQQLRLLQQAGMIQVTARIPQLEYTFRHVLVQESAYNTILLSRRRLLHQQVGEAMEQVFASQLNDQASLLAHHFRQAGDDIRALQHYTVAAESAARLYANEEAAAYYTEAIEAAGRVSLEAISLSKLHGRRGQVHEVLGEFDQARADYEMALRIARTTDELSVEWQALLDLGKFWASRDYQRTGECFEQALALARQMDDQVVLAGSLNRMGNWYINAQRPKKAVAFHQEALAIIEQLGDRRGLANTLDLLGLTKIMIGESKAAAQYYDRAIILFRELDDRQSLVISLTLRGSRGPQYEFHLAESHSAIHETNPFPDEALQISREIGWQAGESFALWTLGLQEAARGQYGKALETMRSGLQIASNIGHHQWMAGQQFNLGILYCDLLVGEDARRHSDLAFALSKEIGSRYWFYLSAATLSKAHLLLDDLAQSQAILESVMTAQMSMDTFAKRYCWARRAELALTGGEPNLALEISDRLVDATPGLSAGGVIPSLWRLRAEALVAVGRLPEAESLFQAAISSAMEGIGERSQLWRIRASLGLLLWDMNRRREAEIEFSAALRQIEELATTIPDEALKDNFLQRAHEKASPPS